MADGNSSDYREDEPHESGDFGVLVLAVRNDVASALAGTDGDYIPFIVDANGRLHIAGEITASALPTGASTSANQQPPVTTAAVYNITLAAADTEYSQALTANTREFRFRCRTLFDVRFAFVTGKVATPTAPYLTLPGGSDYWSDNDNLAVTTLYLATDEAGIVVEIETWA